MKNQSITITENAEFTQDEKNLLLQVINNLQISPSQQNAVEIMTLLQNIIKKLTPEIVS